MAKDANGTEMVQEPLTDTPKVEVEEKPKGDPAVKPEDFQKAQDELDKTRKALKEANKEAAERRIRLEELEKAEVKRKEAEMSEAEKLQATIKQLESDKADLFNKQKESERRELQRKVAKTVEGFPEGLAERLRGETEEEMTEDAKLVLASLPKPQEATPDPKKPAPKTLVTNPGDGLRGETQAQKKARLMGGGANVWDSDLSRRDTGILE